MLRKLLPCLPALACQLHAQLVLAAPRVTGYISPHTIDDSYGSHSSTLLSSGQIAFLLFFLALVVSPWVYLFVRDMLNERSWKREQRERGREVMRAQIHSDSLKDLVSRLANIERLNPVWTSAQCDPGLDGADYPVVESDTLRRFRTLIENECTAKPFLAERDPAKSDAPVLPVFRVLRDPRDWSTCGIECLDYRFDFTQDGRIVLSDPIVRMRMTRSTFLRCDEKGKTIECGRSARRGANRQFLSNFAKWHQMYINPAKPRDPNDPLLDGPQQAIF